MTRVVKSREYATRVGYIPDEFAITVEGTEEKTTHTYLEVYQQSDPFFTGLSKTVSEKMISAGWKIHTEYSDKNGRIEARFEGNRKECIGTMFLELAFQAKCFYEDEYLLEAFNDVEVRDTWREDNL